jgi:Xaa-Pro aminopeptidase
VNKEYHLGKIILTRLNRLRNKLKEQELESILVSQPDNIFYLSGFKGSDGWLLITQNISILAVDFRYIEQAKIEAPGFEILQIKGNITNWFPEILIDHKLKNIGIEGDYLTITMFQHLQNVLKNQHELKIIITSNIIESLRNNKDPSELKKIEQAAILTDKAIEYGMTILKPGIKENQFAWKLEQYLRDNGSEQLPFDIIVASGPHSAWPHAKPTERIILEDEPITIDIGAKINGYCCDISRTFCLGSGNTMFHKIYDIALSAQLAACSSITAGMTGQAADLIARTIISEAGYKTEFGHGLGHGIGLVIHELPRLGPNSDDILSNSMVFTIEPGIYIAGWGGVRIEDSVTLDNNRISVLSKTTKIPNL